MGISVRKIGHVGILVADVQRSLDFYTDVMGFTVTSLRKDGEGEVVGAFMRFDEEHHNFVIGKAPVGVDVEAPEMRDRLVQQISFEVDNRDEFLKSVAHLRSKGAKIVAGPLVHGFEGDGKNFNGSGSRSVYFSDPDGNRLEIFTDMMRVPHGEQFPRAEYADLFETLRLEAGPLTPTLSRDGGLGVRWDDGDGRGAARYEG